MRIIRLKEVIKMTGLSRSTIYERMSMEEFPASINLGGSAVGWLESEVCKWIESRIQNRDSQSNKPLYSKSL
ncbi:AlpA family transcriptional regulator [Vibrio tubiashii]|uniref:Transcriptional regulator n=1 Tax=Vibrio tubiashii ATCC 19109 TaxID=1051646 RepID=F9T4G0_9VIBR|nr:AlpA family transcriptional regulator [Vibrio tubiashii]AIW13315.1 transcriptional regulator [Vibrio tubiashii ATCC 19109]EGU56071.1 transcriptional regulator [Vibrio tubiashii ATCC 19109]EIF04283.1 transcriptional regulator [Vibrio tubiashii NCIMB 1337 = ATCC 19106]